MEGGQKTVLGHFPAAFVLQIQDVKIAPTLSGVWGSGMSKNVKGLHNIFLNIN